MYTFLLTVTAASGATAPPEVTFRPVSFRRCASQSIETLVNYWVFCFQNTIKTRFMPHLTCEPSSFHNTSKQIDFFFFPSTLLAICAKKRDESQDCQYVHDPSVLITATTILHKGKQGLRGREWLWYNGNKGMLG